jgi:hypothetical protein
MTLKNLVVLVVILQQILQNQLDLDVCEQFNFYNLIEKIFDFLIIILELDFMIEKLILGFMMNEFSEFEILPEPEVMLWIKIG